MSRQINLLNLALLPSRDWLSLSLLIGIALLIVVVESALYVKARMDWSQVARQETELADESKRLQEQISVLSKALSEQHSDPVLQTKIEQRTAEVQASEEVLGVLRGLKLNQSGFVSYFQSFSRQAMNGLWLTEFSLSGDALVIKGRMLDVSLLPTYISRLNNDPDLKGRSFAALDMKAVDAEPAPAAGNTKGEQTAAKLPAYTEFSLQGVGAEPVRK